MEWLLVLLFTTLVSIIGYFFNRFFNEFDEFKVHVNKRFSLISDEIAKSKAEIFGRIARPFVIDTEARKDIEKVQHSLNIIKEEVGSELDKIKEIRTDVFEIKDFNMRHEATITNCEKLLVSLQKRKNGQ